MMVSSSALSRRSFGSMAAKWRDRTLSHFSSVEELHQKTQTLLSYLQLSRKKQKQVRSKLFGKEEESSDHNKEDAVHRDCWYALSGWMQVASSQSNNAIFAADDRLAAACKAHELVNLMMQQGQTLQVHGRDVGVVLSAYAGCIDGQQHPERAMAAADRAQSLLDQLLIAHRNGAYTNRPKNKLPPEPTTRLFNTLMDCWAKTACSDAGHRAETVAAMMEAWSQERQSIEKEDNNSRESSSLDTGCQPDVITRNSILHAWSKSGHADGPERVVELLDEAISQRQELNSISFNSAIDTWIKSGRGRPGMKKAEEILDRMIALNESGDACYTGKVGPDAYTYSTILSGWAQCDDDPRGDMAAKRAEKALYQMIRSYKTSSSNVKPNQRTFSSVIHAWSRNKTAAAPEHAERILNEMIQLYRETNDPDWKPDVVTFSSVLSAWARSPRSDSVRRAERAYEKLVSCTEPDRFSFNILLSAYSRAGLGRKALELLHQLEKKKKASISSVGARRGRRNRKNNNMTPDVVSYNTVLQALARDQTGTFTTEAEDIFGRMSCLAEQGRDEVRPTQYTFLALLNVWSRSPDAEALTKAYALVKSLIEASSDSGDESLKPDTRVLNHLIKVCAHVEGTGEVRRRALEIALEVLSVLENSPSMYGGPDHFTYPLLIKTVNRHEDNAAQRSNLILSILDGCISRGLYSDGVVHELRKASISTPTKPEWCRNVPHRAKPWSGLK